VRKYLPLVPLMDLGFKNGLQLCFCLIQPLLHVWNFILNCVLSIFILKIY